MNKTIYFTLLFLMLVSCTAKDISLNNETGMESSIIDYKRNINNLDKNNLFSYVVRMDSGPSPLLGYPGQFEWNNHCLVFVLEESNEMVTPIFPVQSTYFDTSKQLIEISRNKYAIGQNVVLGGSITESANNKAPIITKGSNECLMRETITII